MRRQLPPFSAVRAFEASARLMSFKKAASELCLTQSAISHQVKALENYLGTQLFYREASGVCLTNEGFSYLGGIGDVLDRMAAETARVSKREAGGKLSVRAAPGFVRWLLPRLSSFQACWPDVELHLSSSLVPADFTNEDIDLNVRWGFALQPGLSVTPLIASSRHPVVSPRLLHNGPVLEKPEDLRNHTLLHEGACRNFEKWFHYAREPEHDLRRSLSLANYDHVVDAAVEGQGVALGYDVIVEDDVQAGRLVRLFDVAFPELILYSLVTPESWVDRPWIRAFRSWLIKETVTLVTSESLRSLASAGDLTIHARP